MKRINSAQGLRDYLLELSMGEEEKKLQKKQASAVKDSLKGQQEDLDEADDEADDEPEGDDAHSSSIDVPDLTKKEISSVTTADIVKAINLIRAGKSVKEKDVQAQIRAYMQGLTKGERQSMYTFLLALANILVAGQSGKDEKDPQELGIRIKATKIEKSPEKVGDEEGTEASPITVGESANKANERLVLERHK